MTNRGNIENEQAVFSDLPNGRVEIEFFVPVQVAYLENYDPGTRKVTEISGAESFEDGRVVVETGSTMVILLRGDDKDRMLKVRNYRNRTRPNSVKEPGAHVKESYLSEDNQMKKRNVAKLSCDEPIAQVDDLGIFTWTENTAERGN